MTKFRNEIEQSFNQICKQIHILNETKLEKFLNKERRLKECLDNNFKQLIPKEIWDLSELKSFLNVAFPLSLGKVVTFSTWKEFGDNSFEKKKDYINALYCYSEDHLYDIIEVRAKQLFNMKSDFALTFYRFLFQFDNYKENSIVMMIKILMTKTDLDKILNITAHSLCIYENNITLKIIICKLLFENTLSSRL